MSDGRATTNGNRFRTPRVLGRERGAVARRALGACAWLPDRPARRLPIPARPHSAVWRGDGDAAQPPTRAIVATPANAYEAQPGWAMFLTRTSATAG